MDFLVRVIGSRTEKSPWVGQRAVGCFQDVFIPDLQASSTLASSGFLAFAAFDLVCYLGGLTVADASRVWRKRGWPMADDSLKTLVGELAVRLESSLMLRDCCTHLKRSILVRDLQSPLSSP
jgi:hypothetical protein